MTEFHKKESEELEKEHDKLFETLDEDRKKVVFIYVFVAFRVLSLKQILWTEPHLSERNNGWKYLHLQATKSCKPLKFN